MRRSLFLALLLVVPAVSGPSAASATPERSGDPASYVNPFVGTKEADGGNGAGDTFPGADVPFGMVQWSPDMPLQPKPPAGAGRYSGDYRDGGYAWEENRLRGFSLTHFSGADCGGAAGDIPFIPYAGKITTSPAADQEHYFSTFSHANETASPGYYKVKSDSGVTTELTATQRSGLGRFTFPQGGDATLLVDAADSMMGSNGAAITVDPATRTIDGPDRRLHPGGPRQDDRR